MKILLTEDDFLTRRVMQVFLRPYGDCDLAINGIEAVDAVKISIKENNHYDLICLDIMMPGMNGKDALKLIRKLEKEANIKGAKIIMTTALNDSESITNSFKEQCDGYLIKPISKEDLKEKLEELKLI